MRVTCLNCDERVLIDTGALSGVPVRALCPRCGAPYEVSLVGDQAAKKPVQVADLAGEVLTLPCAEVREAPRGVETCVLVDLDEASNALRGAAHARPLTVADGYRLGVRMMNVSPLWLLAACVALFAFVAACDWLLVPAASAPAEETAYASTGNEASNRALRTPRREPDKAASQDEDLPDADDTAQTPSRDAAPMPSRDAAPMPSRDAAPTAVTFTNAREEIVTHEGSGASPAPRFTIQLGSFRIAAEAEQQAAGLRAAGFEARVFEQKNSKRPWYCVQTGLFDERAGAESHLAELRAKNLAVQYTLRELK